MDCTWKLYLPNGEIVEDGDMDVLLDHAVERFGLDDRQRRVLMERSLTFWNGKANRWEQLEIVLGFAGKPIVKEFNCSNCSGWYSEHDPCEHCGNEGVCGCRVCDPSTCELCGGTSIVLGPTTYGRDKHGGYWRSQEPCPCYLEMEEIAKWHAEPIVPVFRHRFYSCLECRETLSVPLYDDEIIEWLFLCNYGRQRRPNKFAHEALTRGRRLDELGIGPRAAATVTQWASGASIT